MSASTLRSVIGMFESNRGTFPAACSERIGLQSKSAVWEQNDLHTPSACGGVVEFCAVLFALHLSLLLRNYANSWCSQTIL
jgi:hypothetical protein